MVSCITSLFSRNRLSGFLLTMFVACGSTIHAVPNRVPTTQTATQAKKTAASLSAKERAAQERKRRIGKVVIGCVVVMGVALLLLGRTSPGSGLGRDGSSRSYSHRSSWSDGRSEEQESDDFDRRWREKREQWTREAEGNQRRWREDSERRTRQRNEEWHYFEEEFRRARRNGGFYRGFSRAHGTYSASPLEANEINRQRILREAPGVLGVGANASQAEIERAHRKASLGCHPNGVAYATADEAGKQRMADRAQQLNIARAALEEEMRRNGQWS